MNEPIVIKPVRTIEGRMDRLGKESFFITSQLSEAEIESLFAKGNCIRGAEIRDWADKFKISLDDKDITDFVRALNFMRVTVHGDEALPFQIKAFEGHHEEVAKSLRVLNKNLPKLIEVHKQVGSLRSKQTIEVFEDLLLASKYAANYLRNCEAAWGKPQVRQRSAPWHNDVIFLAHVLNKSSNAKSVPVSVTKEGGRGVKFIQKALLRATGKARTEQAIIQVMNRYKRNIKMQLSGA